MLVKVLIIGLGGFAGSISRYLMYHAFDRHVQSFFPYGTLTVNVLGSLLLGVVFGLMQRQNVLSEEWRIFLAIGFCGSFTTFSTFAYENMVLIRENHLFSLALYVSLSLALAVMATYAGYILSK